MVPTLSAEINENGPQRLPFDRRRRCDGPQGRTDRAERRCPCLSPGVVLRGDFQSSTPAKNPFAAASALVADRTPELDRLHFYATELLVHLRRYIQLGFNNT